MKKLIILGLGIMLSGQAFADKCDTTLICQYDESSGRTTCHGGGGGTTRDWDVVIPEGLHLSAKAPVDYVRIQRPDNRVTCNYKFNTLDGTRVIKSERVFKLRPYFYDFIGSEICTPKTQNCEFGFILR